MIVYKLKQKSVGNLLNKEKEPIHEENKVVPASAIITLFNIIFFIKIVMI